MGLSPGRQPLQELTVRTYLERVLWTGVTAMTALLCSVGPAQAVIYTGAWDPPFGTPPFNLNLLWSGTFAVDTDCPTTGAGSSEPDDPPCGPVNVQSAAVTLTGKLLGADINETLTFNPDGAIDSVTKVEYAANKIVQLQTGLSEWLTPSGTVYQFALQFVIDGAAEITDPLLPTTPLPLTYSGPILFIKGPGGAGGATAVSNGNGGPPDLQIWRANVEDPCCTPVFTGLLREGAVAIPEPGSLALIASALFATGWVARIRRRRSSQSALADC